MVVTIGGGDTAGMYEFRNFGAPKTLDNNLSPEFQCDVAVLLFSSPSSERGWKERRDSRTMMEKE